MRRLPRYLASTGAITLVGLVTVGGGPAGAQPAASPAAADVATAIAEAGWYADGESVGDREQLADVAERLSRQGEPMGFALLAAEPPGGSPAYAEQVLGALPAAGEQAIRTVVVLSDADVGVVSDVWSDGAIDDALDETIDALRADPTDGLEALADSLAGQPAGFEDEDDGSTDSEGGPGSGMLVLAVVALGVIALVSRFVRGSGGGDGLDGGYDGYSSSSWRRRRRSSYRSSSSRRSFRSSSRRSSGGSRRGRGGRRL